VLNVTRRFIAYCVENGVDNTGRPVNRTNLLTLKMPTTILHLSNEPGELSQWLCHSDSPIKFVLELLLWSNCCHLMAFPVSLDYRIILLSLHWKAGVLWGGDILLFIFRLFVWLSPAALTDGGGGLIMSAT